MDNIPYSRYNTFDWDDQKDAENQAKHGVAFKVAQRAFGDPKRVIEVDLEHSRGEQRFFCYGRTGEAILTVRFTLRDGWIRIIGACYWRKGKAIYEKENNIHRWTDRENPPH